MDTAPRALVRWLPLLALVLAAESLGSLLLRLTAPESSIGSMLRTMTHLPHLALLLGLAIALQLAASEGASRIACQRLLWGVFAAIAATALARYQDVYFWMSASWALLTLQGLGSILLGIAGPGLWGTAVARQEDLQYARIPRVGRLFAAAALVGFALYAPSEAARLAGQGLGALAAHASVSLVTFSLLLFASRITLLCCAISSWREAPDEESSLKQARRAQGLMIAWLAATAAGWILSSLLRVFEAPAIGIGDSVMLIWHAMVQVTLSLIGTLLVALSLERPSLPGEPRGKRALFPEPPPPGDNSPIDVP
ncbi:MAG: hypothetical protein HY293_01115 [Planctomycetes bacterium]|nr:hypothetical protein [Planctomycetota bacterium]